MRKAREDLDELVGLTIEGVSEIDPYRVLRFTDGTYAAFASQGDSECCYAPELTSLDEHPYSDAARAYVTSGVWSEADYDAWARRNEDDRRKEAEAREASERAQYERLKAKFG